MKSKIVIASSLVVGVAMVIGMYTYIGPILIRHGNMVFDDSALLLAKASDSLKKHRPPTPPPPTTADFAENFDTLNTVIETGSMSGSKSPIWWVSSGAYFYSANGVGSTILGTLPAADPWRVAYALSNSLDTDNGYHPQNIFRLVLRSTWQNLRQEAYFQIKADNLSASPNRNASNGLLLFNRYQDAFNLYYTGIRVDGYAVIKKKISGTYYTMAYKPLIEGPAYNRDSSPNLLPKNIWIGLRSEVLTNADGTVDIKLFVDRGKTGNWVLAAEAKDDGKNYGGGAFLGAGYAGIRTDFMDVEFDDYRIVTQ